MSLFHTGNLVKRVWLALKMHCRLWLALKNDSRQRALERSQDSDASFVARHHAGFAGNTAFAGNAGQQPRQQRWDVGQGLRDGSAVWRTPAHAYRERMRAQAQPVAAPVVDVGGREGERGLPRLGFDLCQHRVQRAESELSSRSALINMLPWGGGSGSDMNQNDMNQKGAGTWWQDTSSWRQLGQQQVSQVSVSAAIPVGLGGRPMGTWGSRMCADVAVPRAPECAHAHPAHAHRLDAAGSLSARDNWGTALACPVCGEPVGAVQTNGQLAGGASCACCMMLSSRGANRSHSTMSKHGQNGGPSCGAAAVGSKDGAVTLGISWHSARGGGPSVGFSHCVGGSDWGAQVCHLE